MPRREISKLIMFFNYILQSEKNKSLYKGFTNNLRRRLEKHNQGLVRSTKPYRPWRLIYYEACLDEKDARRRERYLKTTQGQRLLKRRLKEYFYKSRSEISTVTKQDTKSISRNSTTGKNK